jgi:hypothetical protein
MVCVGLVAAMDFGLIRRLELCEGPPPDLRPLDAHPDVVAGCTVPDALELFDRRAHIYEARTEDELVGCEIPGVNQASHGSPLVGCIAYGKVSIRTQTLDMPVI